MEKKGYPNKTNRKIGYDIFRIFACFGVILNHTILIYDRYGEIHPWKYLVVTALFCLCKSAVTIYLLLSSALLLKKEESYRDWFFKRLLRMIFILIVWSIIYIDTNEWRKSNSLIHTISTIISRESSLHLWYLYMFLGICIMLPFLRKMVAGMKKEDWTFFFLIWFVLGGIPYYNAFFVEHPLILSPYFSVEFLSGFTAIYIMGYRIDSLKTTNKRLFIATIVFFAAWFINIAATYFTSVTVSHSARNFDSPLMLPVVLNACAGLYIAKWINEYFSKKHIKVFNFIIELSRCTLGIYLIHPLVLNWIWSHNTHLLYTKFFSNYVISIHQTLFLSMVVFTISALIVYIMRKFPFLKKIV